MSSLDHLAQKVQQLEALLLGNGGIVDQERVSKCEETYSRVQESIQQKNSYAVAIIDAEVLGFDPRHLRGGKLQGKFVRQAVNEGLQVSLSHMGVNTIHAGSEKREQPEIHLFLLIDSANRVRRSVRDPDYVAEPNSIKQFYQGFHDSENCLLVDGDATLRERKMAGLLDFFLPQANCRRVFIAGWAPPKHYRPSPEEFKARTALSQKVEPMLYDKIVLLQQAGADTRSFLCSDSTFSPENVLCYTRTELPCVFKPATTPSPVLLPAFRLLECSSSSSSDSGEDDMFSDTNSSFSTACSSSTANGSPSQFSWTELSSPSTSISSPASSCKSSISPLSSPTRPARMRSITAPQSEKSTSVSAEMKRSASQIFASSIKKIVPGMPEYEVQSYSAVVKSKGESYAAYLKEVEKHPELAHAGPVHKVNPTLPMSKQTIPPCNNYYLTEAGCTNPEKCKFSHYFMLNPEQLDALRKGAKAATCKNLLKGGICPQGNACLFGGH